MICQRISIVVAAVSLLAMPAEFAFGDIAGTVPDPIQREAQKWAVIVGVGEYADNGLNDLPNAVYDAVAVRDGLINSRGGYPEDNVILLTSWEDAERAPTRTNIMKFVNSYFSQSGPDDTILFYFAGHGITDSEPGSDDKQLYLMPSDSSLSNVPFSGFAFANIEDTMRRAPAKSKVLILDACHSGTGRSSALLSEEAQDEMIRASEGMVVLASCKANELSHEMPDTNHGAFTYFLLDALRGKPEVDLDGNGLISAYEMNSYTRDKTNRWAMKQGFNQTPWHREEGASEIFLARVPEPGDPRPVIVEPVRPDEPTRLAAVPKRMEAVLPPAPEKIVPPDPPIMLAKLGEQKPGDVRAFAGMDFVWIPPGNFKMGTPSVDGVGVNDESEHWVTISKGFWMSKYEISQAEWRRVSGQGAFHARGERLPVESVSWLDVQDFLRELNGHGEEMFRLPTEAEWEYACKANGNTAYATGETIQHLANLGWYEHGDTHELGGKKPNAWGLHDMHGNIWEWCADWYGGYPVANTIDPLGSEIGAHRVMRGGSVGSSPDECRSAFRRSESPSFRNYRVGFRLVR